MDRDDIQRYIAARKWRPQMPRVAWRRWLRPRFSLTALVVLITILCAVFAYLHARREYPRLEFQRSYTTLRGRRCITDQIRLKFATMSEHYWDYEPLGTVNSVTIPVDNGANSRIYSRLDSYPPYADPPEQIPPDCRRRYESLRALVAERVDLDSSIPGGTMSWVLPVDYPTFDEFVAELRESRSENP